MTDCSRDESLYNCCRDGLLSDSLELIAKGANVNWQNPKENQSTAVFAASFNGHGSIVRALVQSGANVDCCNRDGMFSLFIAAQYNHVECLQELILAGADLNACAIGGATALFIASYVGHAAIVRLLLAGGADPHIGSSCLECARNRGFTKVAKLFELHPPGCLEGFIFDSSTLFSKWRRRFFVVSLSSSSIIVSSNPICAQSNVRASRVHPSDDPNCINVRGYHFMQLANFESKHSVLMLSSSGSSSSAKIHYLALSSKFSTDLMMRWLSILGVRSSVNSLSLESAELRDNHRIGKLTDRALLHLRPHSQDSQDEGRVPLLLSSDV